MSKICISIPMAGKTRLLVLGILLFVLGFSNNLVLFQLAYTFVCIALIIHTILLKYRKRDKLFMISIYVMVFVFQSVYNNLTAFSKDNTLFTLVVHRIIGLIFVFAPFTIDGIINRKAGGKFLLPSVDDIKVFTFNEVIENIEAFKKIITQGQKTFSKKNMDELLNDLPRHNSFRYINKGSLTSAYFESAYQTLDDLRIYIVISNTGSPASEIISIFTRKQYNHVSLAFDKELKTIVSYNGGEKIFPPGLNMEMIKYLNKKNDASIIVYSLPIAREQKKIIIDKIQEINEQGNAYNILGLVLKLSFRPNIMFCSQFVYKMLKIAGVKYFEMKEEQIKPTDFIEMDYERKLKYEYRIMFNGA
jgi:hypothetical protein